MIVDRLKACLHAVGVESFIRWDALTCLHFAMNRSAQQMFLRDIVNIRRLCRLRYAWCTFQLLDSHLSLTGEGVSRMNASYNALVCIYAAK